MAIPLSVKGCATSSARRRPRGMKCIPRFGFNIANRARLAQLARRYGQAMGKRLASSGIASVGSGPSGPVPPRRREDRRPVASRAMQFAGNGSVPTEGKLRSYADELTSPRRFSHRAGAPVCRRPCAAGRPKPVANRRSAWEGGWAALEMIAARLRPADFGKNSRT